MATMVVTEGLVSEESRSEAGLDQEWSSSLRFLKSLRDPKHRWYSDAQSERRDQKHRCSLRLG